MRIAILTTLALLGAGGVALAQTTSTEQPGSTPQNQSDFLEKTAKDPAFAGGEKPKETGAIRDPSAPAPREGMNYTPTKTPDESTQQPK